MMHDSLNNEDCLLDVPFVPDVPDSFKTGIVTLLYKGGGKDPLDTHSYRGITLTSVLAKVLESLILTRLQCHFSEKGIPQTSYRKGVSCADAIILNVGGIYYPFTHNAVKKCTCVSTTCKRRSTPSITPFS